MAKRTARKGSRMIGDVPPARGGTRTIAGATRQTGGTPKVRGAPQKSTRPPRAARSSGHRSSRETQPGRATGRTTPLGRKGAVRTVGLPQPKREPVSARKGPSGRARGEPVRKSRR